MNLDYLNSKQKECVLNTDGPIMIIAGAGSGKTSVLTHKISYLISKGVSPYNILALTFTNKSAKEMQNRVSKIIKSNIWDLSIGTFHSIFLKVLKIEYERIGFDKNFSIYDSQDSRSLVKDIIKYLDLNPDIYKENIVFSRISFAKNKLIDYSSYSKNLLLINEDENCKRPALKDIYAEYSLRCKRSNCMDFDDIIYFFYAILNSNKDTLEKYQNLYKYILVDEFQDTNFAQYEILKLLSKKNNICIVGDDAQSIYAFRGANISNILSFEKDFPNTKKIKLEQNYRSTKSILNAANSLISKNQNQIEKNVWTENETGEVAKIFRLESEIDEAIHVGKNIISINLSQKNNFSDFAVLYRSNFQSRAFEQTFKSLNIPYEIIGSISFFQRKEIKDLISYIKMSINKNDEESLKRIINFPKRGIGDYTLVKILDTSVSKNMKIWDVLENSEILISRIIKNKLVSFVTLINKIYEKEKNIEIYDYVKYILQESKILEELLEKDDLENKEKIKNINEFLNYTKLYSQQEENKDKNIYDFINDLSIEASNKEETDNNSVKLMTIHSSKGLEFENVFIVGVEEDIFPPSSVISSIEELEEERRLFYVAITRAKKLLFISYCTNRYAFGKVKSSASSRFLKDIDKKFYNQIDFKVITNIEAKLLSMGKLIDTTHQSENNICKDSSELCIGKQVIHPRFGIGVVTGIDDSSIDSKVKIKFKPFDEKTFILKYACIQII